MVSVNYYYVQITLTPGGEIRDILRKDLNKYFSEKFPEFTDLAEISEDQDQAIQATLIRELKKNYSSLENLIDTVNTSKDALLLRNRLRYSTIKCVKNLVAQFGSDNKNHRFTIQDLLLRILIDDGRPLSNEDIKDIRDIRQRDEYFDTIIFLLEYLTNKASENLIPIEACLLTKIRQSNAFELFLLEHGLWLRSDWGILNSKKASKKKLQKIAGLFAHLSEKERPDLWYFLKSFQTVYRPSRRGQYGRCSPPDEIQLQEMVDLLQNEYGLTISTEDLNNKLHEIAELFRSYKIMNQNGQLPNTTSLDETDNHGRSLESRLLSDSIVEKVKEIKEVEEDDNHLQYVSGEDIEKCKKYLENCLPRILQQILDNLTPRTQNLKHKILPAFRLLLCDGCSQVDLEQQLQITQSQVSRRIQPLYIQFFREVYLTVEDSWIRNQLKKLEKILTREKLQNYDEVNLKLKQCFGQYIAPMLFSAEDVKIGNAKTRKKCNNTENTSIYKNMLCNYLSTNTGNIENSQKAG